jgi:ABC-type polysaccharide/polyol phosphate transport system ATPase subunit
VDVTTGGTSTDQPASAAERARADARAAEYRERFAGAPLAIDVADLHKTFRIPKNRITSFKERAVHPLTRQEYYELHALRGISFQVRRGEFFGIVGRNGSGKSTLLKILASIYRADSGRIRMAGRPAPFIELGVGFDPELTARENVVLNGVMMGLSQREARRRLDAVLDFAELRDFVDLKFKNYSSGMMVRLAFSVMIHAPPTDILLIDEVLAVGDASFQQKCANVFHEMRDGDRTVVLVTHDMTAVETYCHRAMAIHDGRIRLIGDPDEVGKEYIRLNFEGPEATAAREDGAVPERHARLIDSWLEDEDGTRIANVEVGRPIRFGAVIEARERLREPLFAFHVINAEGVHVFAFNHSLRDDPDAPETLEAGQRVRLLGTIENRLQPGRYFMSCWVVRSRERGDMGLQSLDVLDFVVFGVQTTGGVVSMPVEIEASTEQRVEP